MKSALFCILTAFGLSLLFCVVLIPMLRRFKAGQNILSYVKEHKGKSGTPTMGGLAFISAAVLAAVFFIGQASRGVVLALIVGVAYMCVGLLDDFLKCKHKENLGLKAWQKFSFQACIAVLVGIFCIKNGITKTYLPFTQIVWDMGFFALPIIVLVFLGTVNAVNLTDGLDGLASSVSIPYFLSFALITAIQKGENGLSVIGFALVGALCAYLLFNVSPARVFMGDTGSLSLGGFAACVGVFSENTLSIAVIGLPFVISVISVLMQVIYYKVTGGKRIFLMAPIHHHFQQKGYSESTISYAYFAVTSVLGCVCALVWI